MNNQFEYFFDRKKVFQHQARVQARQSLTQARRDTWAAKLKPFQDIDRDCCKKKCVRGGTPIPVLEASRKVSIYSPFSYVPTPSSSFPTCIWLIASDEKSSNFWPSTIKWIARKA
jgi:hypothetical protein